MTFTITIQITDMAFIGAVASVFGALFGAGCLAVNYLMYRKM